ncbi:DUF58 domain-containing protein [Anaerocolumna xylanovorans]|uniref:Uncharacterized protein n=1 Tax=Anaerocolumna xylanovorans DSM 12503 TaxID=1121345 RepID=A0A1M7Y5T6_9FIRM|nr:DUF58 domain-containing protein [Anaerocolumna xylanovorans]SHO47842.1 Protein of unknown function DUF58 [Anaerocolumna xylanovorans DSM 12503]
MSLLAAVLGAFLLYLFQKYLYQKWWAKNLSIELTFNKDTAVEGNSLTLVETVTNRKLLPLPLLKVKFRTSKYLEFPGMENATVTDNYYRSDVISLMMYQKFTRQLPFQCKHRGYFTVDRTDIICSNLFLSSEMVMDYPQHLTLYVYPKTVAALPFEQVFKTMLGTVLTKRFTNEDPFEFRSIREYQPYDALKSVNWKASSKTGELKVNAYNYTSSFQVKLLLNLERETALRQEDLEEESIRLASTLSEKFLAQGIPVSLLTNCKNISGEVNEVIQAGSGIHHLDSINKSLSLLDTSNSALPFVSCLGDECMTVKNEYIIFLSTYQKEDFQKLLCDMTSRKIDFFWILPINKDVIVTVKEELKSKTIIWMTA